MAWVVDTCLLLDVLDDDPAFGRTSAKCLQDRLRDKLVICPISFVELAPAFLGDHDRQTDFLTRMGVVFSEPWDWADTLTAHRAWARYVELKSAHKIAKRPIADLLIGSFASRFGGLITRNPSDFKLLFPSVKLVCPSKR
jgi:predicted nucleic acid-binding protein